MIDNVKLTLSIDSGNAAITDAPVDVTVEILEQVIAKITSGQAAGKLRDTNGNTVGSFELTIDEANEDETDNED